jgi:hypothetical protein
VIAQLVFDEVAWLNLTTSIKRCVALAPALAVTLTVLRFTLTVTLLIAWLTVLAIAWLVTLTVLRTPLRLVRIVCRGRLTVRLTLTLTRIVRIV